MSSGLGSHAGDDGDDEVDVSMHRVNVENTDDDDVGDVEYAEDAHPAWKHRSPEAATAATSVADPLAALTAGRMPLRQHAVPGVGGDIGVQQLVCQPLNIQCSDPLAKRVTDRPQNPFGMHGDTAQLELELAAQQKVGTPPVETTNLTTTTATGGAAADVTLVGLPQEDLPIVQVPSLTNVPTALPSPMDSPLLYGFIGVHSFASGSSEDFFGEHFRSSSSH